MDINEVPPMTDLLVRDVPEHVVAAIDAKAKRLGLSRTGAQACREQVGDLGDDQRRDVSGPGWVSSNRGRVSRLVNGRTAVTGETAILLSRVFGPSPEFWMRLQADDDLALAREAMS